MLQDAPRRTEKIWLPRRNADPPNIIVTAEISEDGLFAVHPTIEEGAEAYWTVTHVPTLCALTTRCLRAAMGWSIVAALRSIGCDWSSAEPRYYAAEFAKADPEQAKFLDSLRRSCG